MHNWIIFSENPEKFSKNFPYSKIYYIEKLGSTVQNGICVLARKNDVISSVRKH